MGTKHVLDAYRDTDGKWTVHCKICGKHDPHLGGECHGPYQVKSEVIQGEIPLKRVDNDYSIF